MERETRIELATNSLEGWVSIENTGFPRTLRTLEPAPNFWFEAISMQSACTNRQIWRKPDSDEKVLLDLSRQQQNRLGSYRAVNGRSGANRVVMGSGIGQ